MPSGKPNHRVRLVEPPYTFTTIHLRYVAKGAVSPKKLERAIQLSEDKYCSVINTLKPIVKVTNDFEILAADSYDPKTLKKF